MATDGYEWDAAKATANLRKHGVDFADAATALEDPLCLTMTDPDSNGEERSISIGKVGRDESSLPFSPIAEPQSG